MFVFLSILVRALNCISKARAKTVFGHLNMGHVGNKQVLEFCEIDNGLCDLDTEANFRNDNSNNRNYVLTIAPFNMKMIKSALHE